MNLHTFKKNVSLLSTFKIVCVLALITAFQTACKVDPSVISDLLEDKNVSVSLEPTVVRPASSSTPVPEPTLRFIAVGDTGHGGDKQMKVAQAMTKKCQTSGCDFVLMLGDNIYDSGVSSVDDPQFISKFEMPYADIKAPFYLVMGNHDFGSQGFGINLDKFLHQVNYSEKSPGKKWNMPWRYYQLKYGNFATFLGLDTNSQMLDLDSHQRQTVKAWITQSNHTWKIAFGHHTYKSNGPHGNAGEYEGDKIDEVAAEISSLPGVHISEASKKGKFIQQLRGKFVKRFAEQVWCGKVDVYLAGHEHSRQWLKDGCDGTALIISGAGSGTTELVGNHESLFQSDQLGFLYVTLRGNKFIGEFVDENGDTEFTHTISK